MVSASSATILLASAAVAQVVWDGSTSTNFATGTNWVGNVAPGAADNALVDQSQAPPRQPTVSVAGTVSNLTVVDAGSRITVGAPLTVTNLLTIGAGGTALVNAGQTLSAGSVTNNATGLIDSAGTLTSVAAIANAGVLINRATATINGGLTNTNVVTAAGAINGAVANNGGTFTVAGGNLAANSGFTNANGAVLVATGGDLTGVTALNNSGYVGVGAGRTLSVASVTNNATGTVENVGTLTSGAVIASAGILINRATGTMNGGVNNTGTLTQIAGGATNGGLTNTGAVSAAGTIGGAIANNGGTFTVTGNLVADNAFINANGATANVNGGDLTGVTAFINSGALNIAATRTLAANTVTINGTGTASNFGTLTSGAIIANAGNLTNRAGGAINGGINNTGTFTQLAGGVANGGLTNTGAVSAAGTINGAIANNGGAFTVTGGNLVGDNTFTNANGATVNVNGGNLTGVTTFTNSGVLNIALGRTLAANRIVNDGTGTINGDVNNTTTFTQLAGGVTNGKLTNTGAVNAAGAINGAIANNAGTFTVTGALIGDNATTTFTNAGGATLAVSGGSFTGITTLTNSGAITVAGGMTLAANTIANQATGTISNFGTLTSAGVIANAGSLANRSTGTINGGVNNTGTFTQLAGGTTNGGLTNSNIASVAGTINGAVNNTGTFTITGGDLGGVTALTNSGYIGIGAGLTLTAASVTNNAAGMVENFGTLTSGAAVANGGRLINRATGAINGGVNNTGTFTQLAGGVTNGGLTNTGAVSAAGAVNGAIANNGGTFTVTGALVGDNATTTFTNAAGATLAVSGGDFTGITTLTNSGAVNVTATRLLSAGSVTNNAGGSIDNSGTLTSAAAVANAGVLLNRATGTINGGLTNTNTVVAAGAINGVIANNAGTFTVAGGDLVGNNDFTNAGGAKLVVSGGNFSGVGALTNGGYVGVGAGRTVSAASVTNNATGTVENFGILTSGAVIASAGNMINQAGGTINGGVNNTGTFTQAAGGTANGGFTNTGIVNAAGTISGAIANNGGAFTVAGGNLVGDNAFTNANGATLAVSGGDFTGVTTLTNSGAVNVAAPHLLSAGVIANAATGAVSNSGTLTSGVVIANAGTINNNATGVINGGVNNTGTFSQASGGQTNGGLTNANIVDAAGAIRGAIANDLGTFTVTGGNLVGDNNFANAATLNVNGGDFTGVTALANNGNGVINVAATRLLSAGAITNTALGAIGNSGTLTSGAMIANAGILNNNATGVINGGVANIGTFTQLAGGVTNGGLTNTNIVNAAGTINGAIANNAGTFTVTGVLLGNGAFTNANGATTALTGGNFTGLTGFTNDGAVNVVGVRTLGAATFNNNATGVINLSVNPAPVDALTLTGNYVGAPNSGVRLDVNIANQTADKLTIQGGANGSSIVGGNLTLLNKGQIFAGGIEVLKVQGADALNVDTGLIATAGFAQYFLTRTTPGSYQVTSQFNTAPVTGVASSIASVIGSLQTSFHQPASAIVSRPDDPRPNQWGGGPFIRFSHGESTVKLDGAAMLGGAPIGSSATSTFSRFTGFQAGADIGLYNINNTGWNINVGLMGGVVDAKASATSTSPGAPLVGTAARLDVPFIGLYAFLSNGPFTAEFNVRKDFYDTTFQSIGADGTVFVLPGTKLKGDGVNFNVNASYRFQIYESWYIEPTGGLSVGRYSFDTLALNNGALPGTANFMTFDATRSVLGRIGFNAGTAFQATDKLIIAPFVHASIWREFGKNSIAHATLTTAAGPPAAQQTFDVSTNRVGTFGQVGGGVQFKLADTPFLGFIRGDIRFGSKVNGRAVNVGLKAQF